MPAPAYAQSSQNTRHMALKAWSNDASTGAPEDITPELMVERTALDNSLRRFLAKCFPEAFPLAFSPTHYRMMDEIQRATEQGGLKAIAAPRGTGKTSILLRAALWAILTGRRRYVAIVAADETSAVGGLDTIKMEIDFNEELFKYYPRELWCFRQIGREPRRAATQHWNGEPTGLEYARNRLIFATVEGNRSSGAVISLAGITGRIRGQQVTTQAGEILRPDFVLVDDPSTKLSAASASQNKKRHEIMNGDVLGLAGPGVKISGFTTCTVIYKDDLADRLLNRRLSPDWNGDRVQMIQKWPRWMAGWDEYNDLRINDLSKEETMNKSRQFVLDNYAELHAEAEVYWEDRKDDNDVSALHHAMDLYFRDQGTFSAEFQNSPMEEHAKCPYELNIEEISRRVTGLGRGQVPEDVDKITAFIDTQREMLYYMVVAWTDTGRAHIIDYGGCPDQKRHHWVKSSIQYPLAEIYGDDFETYLRGGLDWLIKAILENEYTTEEGATVMVDRLAIDARWGESTAIIRKLVRESPYKSRLHPSMGMYIGATSKPWQQLKSMKDKKNERKGVHARLATPKEGGKRELMYDTNYWKSFCADRLVCSSSSPKAIVLFNAKPMEHRMFAEHCACEEPVRVIGKTNNEVVEWKQKGSSENDYWDCIVGNAALASTIGVETHSGNKRSGTGLAKAIHKVLQKKPENQFFRNR